MGGMLKVIFLIGLCKVLLINILAFGYMCVLLMAGLVSGMPIGTCWPVLLIALIPLAGMVGSTFGIIRIAKSIAAKRA